jgi:hypothetical protein
METINTTLLEKDYIQSFVDTCQKHQLFETRRDDRDHMCYSYPNLLEYIAVIWEKLGKERLSIVLDECVVNWRMNHEVCEHKLRLIYLEMLHAWKISVWENAWFDENAFIDAESAPFQDTLPSWYTTIAAQSMITAIWQGPFHMELEELVGNLKLQKPVLHKNSNDILWLPANPSPIVMKLVEICNNNESVHHILLSLQDKHTAKIWFLSLVSEYIAAGKDEEVLLRQLSWNLEKNNFRETLILLLQWSIDYAKTMTSQKADRQSTCFTKRLVELEHIDDVAIDQRPSPSTYLLPEWVAHLLLHM